MSRFLNVGIALKIRNSKQKFKDCIPVSKRVSVIYHRETHSGLRFNIFIDHVNFSQSVQSVNHRAIEMNITQFTHSIFVNADIVIQNSVFMNHMADTAGAALFVRSESYISQKGRKIFLTISKCKMQF